MEKQFVSVTELLQRKLFELLITPEQAKQMLTHNEGNIPLRDSRVQLLADIISRGDWKLTTDAIGFSKTGRLLNGQHRLNACIKANKPILCLVATGLEDNSFMAIDVLNKQKKACDVFALAGVANYNNVTNIVSKAYYLNKELTCSDITTSQRVTPDIMMDIYKGNTDIVMNAVRMADACYNSCNTFSRKIYGGYALYLTMYKKKDPALVKEFFYALADKERSSRSNSMDMLRKRIVNDKNKRTRITGSTFHYLLVNAWNAYQECRFLKCLKPNELDFI